MTEEIVKLKAKCPKCGNRKELTLCEVWRGHTITWEVVDGVFDINDGSLEPGDAYKVEATCICGYHWTIRKALQISDVIE